MSGPRVLLVDDLDAAGAEIGDARERAQALRSVGATVRAVAFHREPASEPNARAARSSRAPRGKSSPQAIARLRTGAEGYAALRTLARDGRFDLAVVASPAEDGGRIARALPRTMETRRIRTGFAPEHGWFERLRAGGADGGRPTVAPTLGGSTMDPSDRRPGQLPLWDGEFVLAPAALGGRAGEALLDAFAMLARSHDELDLVVLAHPQAAWEKTARARGIGTRVHFVGPAPRAAEWGWWSQAVAGVPAGPDALSGGLLLRALAAGCPLIAIGVDPVPAALGAWLEGSGLALGPRDEAVEKILLRAARRDGATTAAIARGREVAAAHAVGSLVERLRGLLDPGRPAAQAA